MYLLPNELTLDALRQYASYLFSRIDKAEHLAFIPVEINGQSPAPNDCHENARAFVLLNPIYKIVYGWICVDGGLESSSIDFIAHSVIQDINGNLYEITPIYSIESRPFLTAELNDHDFADIVIELDRLSGKATLVYHK